MVFRVALAAHLVCAWGAAVVFWIPIVAAKGGPLHTRAGRLYVRLIYLTALTGAPLALLLAIGSPEPGARRTAAFLAYLIVILVMPAYHGARAARASRSSDPRGASLDRALAVTAIAAGLVMFALAVAWQAWHYAIVSPIGPAIGWRAIGDRHQFFVKRKNGACHPREEHMIAMVVSGIAVYTALLVFGIGRTLGVQLTGASLYLPWVLPAAIGLPLLVWGIRRERASLSTSRSTARTPPPL